jgi:hypothetical protein
MMAQIKYDGRYWLTFNEPDEQPMRNALEQQRPVERRRSVGKQV